MHKVPNLTPLQSPQLVTYKCPLFWVHKKLVEIAQKLIQIKERNSFELEFHVSMVYVKSSFYNPSFRVVRHHTHR